MKNNELVGEILLYTQEFAKFVIIIYHHHKLQSLQYQFTYTVQILTLGFSGVDNPEAAAAAFRLARVAATVFLCAPTSFNNFCVVGFLTLRAGPLRTALVVVDADANDAAFFRMSSLSKSIFF